MTKLVSVAGAMAMLAGGAFAQSDQPLSGPTVKQDRPAGLGGQFADGKGDRKGPMVEAVPMRLYVDAIQKLRGEAAPEGLQLTPAQDREIGRIEADFRSTMQEYARRMRAETGGQPKRPKANGQGETEPMAPDAEKVRARLQEMRRNAPNPTDTQVKIYAILNADQQKFVNDEVAKGQAEIEQRRAEDYMQRLLQKKRGEAQPAAPDAVRPEAAPGEMRERARRIIERLQQLPPQEREQILRRLEEELDRRAAAGGDAGRRRPGDGGDRKPPPPMDEVKVPSPSKP